MLIQVDVDSTLYDFDPIAKEVAAEFGIEWPVKAPYWMPPEEYGTTADVIKRVFRKCHSKECVARQIPYPHASEVIQGLARDFEDIELAYVSDRNEQQTASLRSWLAEHGFLSSEDTHVAATKDKRHWMRERKPEIVIDDRVRTMLLARFELDSYVVSLQHPHNQNLKGEVEHIYIVPDWLNIDKILREIIIPKVQEKSLSYSRQKSYV